MRIHEKQDASERVVLEGNLAEFREALEEEIETIKKNGQSSILLSNGRCVDSRGEEVWYRFSVEYAPTLPPDTPCKLIIGKDQFDVTVVSYEENAIILSSKLPLPEMLGSARLENGATVLMERLIKCIEKNAEKVNLAGSRMLPQGGEIYSAKEVASYDDWELEPNNNEGQNRAITTALTKDITYIWGPPGTGKTTVIGQIIKELYRHDRSVLVVSHTNTAVDGAIEKAYETIVGKLKENEADRTQENRQVCPILRIGNTAKSLPEAVELRSHVNALGKELYQQEKKLKAQQTERQIRINEIQILLAKFGWINATKLPELSRTQQKTAALRQECNKLRAEIHKLETTIEQEKATHPEWGKYLVLSKRTKAIQVEYDGVCEQLIKKETAANQMQKQLQEAVDEVKKHDRYARLREQEAKMMSEQFLRNEIARIAKSSNSISDEIKTLLENQASAQDTVAQYEKRSAFAKFFSGKSALTQAQAILETVRMRLPLAMEELNRQQKLEQEFHCQLDALLLLQDQIRVIVPSKTQDYWNQEILRLRSISEETKKIVLSLKSQKASLGEKMTALEEEQKQAKTGFDLVSEYERKRRQEEAHFDACKASFDRERQYFRGLLDEEIASCALFSGISSETEAQTIIERLSELQETVKQELANVDIDAIEHERNDLSDQMLEIIRQLNEIQQKLLGLEEQAIMNAKVIGATLAKSYLSDTLREKIFDTVIVDEASMAAIPALWCVGYLAEKSIIIVGDFLQLPPIVMSEESMAQKWLGKDIFFHSGMQERARKSSNEPPPENFVMLNQQFRMEADIANIANMYYGAYGRLESNDYSEKRKRDREEFSKWYDKTWCGNVIPEMPVTLLDTENLHAWVTGVPQGKGHSRLNCFSAALVVDLAFKLLEKKLNNKRGKEPSVLIVAPYKPHVARINQLIDLEYRKRGLKKSQTDEDPNYIKAGTIHSFQGSEADIVIFDLVIDEPHWKANLFMTSEKINEDLKKMFNVAVTRARFKLILVGNFAYCRKRAKDNALSELLEELIDKKQFPIVDAKKIFPVIVYDREKDYSVVDNLKGKNIICQEASFQSLFETEIRSFHKQMIVYSPFITETRLANLLPKFSDALQGGKEIIVVTKALSERGKGEEQYRKCEKELQSLGIKVFHKKGMHEKLIFIDDTVVWIGSLNALSFTGQTGEVMQRHEDKKLADEYRKLFNIEKICAAVTNDYERVCPICGGEMLLKEGAEGGLYWDCINDDYSRSMEQQYPKDGVLRCKCGAPYLFAMKNEPRWICSADPKHFQKMRESDLKLAKMAALIPTKAARKKVDNYFADRRKEREKLITGSIASNSTKKEKTRGKKTKKDLIVPEQMKLF